MPRKSALSKEQSFEALYLYREVSDREKLSTRGIADEFNKKYGLEIHQSNISRTLDRVFNEIANNPEFAAEYSAWKATNGQTRKAFYRTDTITNKVTSDYHTVQDYIDRITKEEKDIRKMKQIIQEAEKCWMFLDRKDPANWTDDDVEKFIREGRGRNRKPLTLQSKERYKISCRQVAPLVKAVENGTLRHKKAVRENVRILKSPVFHAEFNQIIHSPILTQLESFVFEAHVVFGPREGHDNLSDIQKQKTGRQSASLLGMLWSDYDPRTNTISIFESKAVGLWEDIPIDKLGPFFDRDFASKWRKFWEDDGRPTEGFIWARLGATTGERSKWLSALYDKIQQNFEFLRGKKFTPHFGRKTHANILAEQDIDGMLIIGDASTHSAWFGCGETDLTTYRKYYIDIAKSKLAREYAKAGHFVNDVWKRRDDDDAAAPSQTIPPGEGPGEGPGAA
jgi:hypothetical protein